ncbi:MAG: hypothetical protein HYV14_14135 [Elusimicrobia bacterium]|nr:hypothetical protein [Elusimicrobiota bacterium]
MDIIEVFLDNHRQLRQELTALQARFQRPHGVGWDDCVSLDCKRLLKDIEAFFASFRDHEAAEDEFLREVAPLVKLDAPTRDAFAGGRRAVAEIMKLFSVVAFTFDGEHAHRVRELLPRMSAEVDAHLTFEEKTLFPLMRERLPAALLQEFGEHALHGHSAR